MSDAISSPGVSRAPSLKISVTFGGFVFAVGKNGESDVGDNGGADDDGGAAINDDVMFCTSL